jgi:hypothetical protein
MLLRGKDVFKDAYGCGTEPFDGDSLAYTFDFLGSGNAVLDMFGENCSSPAMHRGLHVQPEAERGGRGGHMLLRSGRITSSAWNPLPLTTAYRLLSRWAHALWWPGRCL